MKDFLGSLFGRKKSNPTIEQVSLDKLHYTMPTVAADNLDFGMPSEQSFVGAPQFHEDEWAQLEFFKSSDLLTIQDRLSDYKSFEQKHRSNAGWSSIYSRKLERDPILRGERAVEELAELFSSTPANSPILHITSRPLGQVKGGFSIEIAPSVCLYGISSPVGITTLAAILFEGADHYALTQAFMRLHQKFDLIFVDWRGQQALISVSADQQIEAWRP